MQSAKERVAGKGDHRPKRGRYALLGGKRLSNSSIFSETSRTFRIFTVAVAVVFVFYIVTEEESMPSSVLYDEDGLSNVTAVQENFSSSSCQPRRNIVFLKTHKCASSSIQNIFNRYGYRHNLTFVLPAKGSYIGHPEPFNWSMVPNPKRFGLHYNILTHHCRFNYHEIGRKMPDDTIFVTIVRHPLELYESVFSFYSLQKFYRERFDTLGKHQRPEGYYDRRMGGKIGFNQMLFDLGFNERQFANVTAVQEYVEFLDSAFHMVMVKERMEESLVLLRHLLCWSIDDVVIFKLNARNTKYRRRMSPDLLQRLVKFNSADFVLYNHFMQRLDLKIKEFGVERMEEEVEVLKNRTKMWFDICVQRQDYQSRVINSRRYYTNKLVMAYVKKKFVNETCDDMTTQEPIFTEKLVYRQRFLFPRPKPYRMYPRYKYQMHRWSS